MQIRCYGARGSIPVSGPEYVRYGGDTCCLEIISRDGKIIIIDAGTGIRRLGKDLMREQQFDYTLLMTHSHWDHVIGFPFFSPLYHQETSLTLIGCPQAQGNMQKLLSRTMSAPFFPVPFNELRARITFKDTCALSYWVGSVEIIPISLNHPNEGLGYKLVEDGKSFVFLTDNELSHAHRGGLGFADYVEFAEGADLLIHDAEYTPEEYEMTRGWGHSTFLDALNLAMEAGVKQFGLFHHNQNRSDADEDALVEQCKNILAEHQVELACFGVTQNSRVNLEKFAAPCRHAETDLPPSQ